MALNVNSLWFVLTALIGLAMFELARSPENKKIILTLINVGFLIGVFQPFFEIYLVLGYAALGYLFVRIAGRYQSGRFFWFAAVVLIGGLIYLKQYSIVEFLPRPQIIFITVGLSFIFFRVMHMLIDVHQGTITETISPVSYFNYLFFFLSFLSGPVQRYEAFNATVENASNGQSTSPQEARDAVNRIVNGYIKVNIFGIMLFAMHAKLLPMMEVPGTSAVLNTLLGTRIVEIFISDNGANLLRLIPLHSIASVLYASYLYLNFSGYMDIVVGFARLFNISIPENFRQPFAAKNFMDFWSRWHITVSEWCRTYIYFPLVKTLQSKFPSRRAQQPIAVSALFVTFVLLGVWHGASNAYLFLGLMLGLGVGLNKAYQVAMPKMMGQEFYTGLCARTSYRYFSRGLAISYFSVCITCMWITPKLQVILFNPRGLMVLCVEVLILGIGLSILYFLSAKFRNGITHGLARITKAPPTGSYGPYMAVKAFFVFSFMIGDRTPHQFVYANF
jgi:alginate O-acetyltransferase complex protein AlgI